MRIILHDFAGHPFQIQLSRELASRGHAVLHLAAEGLPGPKGKLQSLGGAPAGLEIRGVPLSRSFRKYSATRRLVAQWQYARDLEGIVERERPDVVLSGNTPIDAQARLLRCCRRLDIGFVHWVQDVYSLALEYVLRMKIGPAARPAALPYRWLEQWVVRHSDGVVAISKGFVPLLRRWGARDETLAVIENWAPLHEVPRLERRNAWSEAQGLNGEPVFLYSGTLGLKHRPDLIYALSRKLAGRARVVVVSEGVGREYLERQPRLPNLTLLDFQPYERLPEMLASADVLMATLEADAGAFAVPSKVLTYLCAGRTVLLAAPRENLAAEVIGRCGGGVVVAPDDARGWVEAGQRLAEDGAACAAMGLRARQYAEEHFDIGKIAGRFEAVLSQGMGRRARLVPAWDCAGNLDVHDNSTSSV